MYTARLQTRYRVSNSHTQTLNRRKSVHTARFETRYKVSDSNKQTLNRRQNMQQHDLRRNPGSPSRILEPGRNLGAEGLGCSISVNIINNKYHVLAYHLSNPKPGQTRSESSRAAHSWAAEHGGADRIGCRAQPIYVSSRASKTTVLNISSEAQTFTVESKTRK